MKHIVLDPALGTATDAPAEFVRWLGERPHRGVTPGPDVAALGIALLDSNPDHIQLVDAGGNTLWMNQAARLRPGTVAAALRHRHATERYRPSLAAATLAQAIADAVRGVAAHFTVATREVGGRCWWDVSVTRIDAAETDAGRFMVVARDVTAQHAADAAVAHAVSHDALTGLARRELFQSRIETLLADGRGFCVIMIDIDRFRELNLVCGSAAGDDVLRMVGARLARVIRRGEIAARLGGDEFGVVLRVSDGDVAGALKARAQAIVDRLAMPIRGMALLTPVSASAGLAYFPADGASAGTLCRNAEAALVKAKAGGRGLVVHFDALLRLDQERRIAMLARAECALTTRGILPYYQPKVDLLTGQIVSFEALLRWRAPSGAIELPAGIWPAFGEPALARRLTDAMLGRIMVDLGRWQRQGMLLPVAINVSDCDLGQSDFAERLLGRLAAAELPASCIEVEVTETAVLGRNADDFAVILRTMQNAGVRIALDDFGTGYASLTHLRNFPVDVIKIDRGFVTDLTRDRGNRVIVEALLGMARQLGIKVVAEGIENAATARFLRDRGCHLGQGFLFGKGVPACQVMPLLAARRRSIGTAPGDDRADRASAGCAGT